MSTPTEAVVSDTGRKVFVGNLSFNTKESELAEFLKPAGIPESVSIVIRHNTSCGYAFVIFRDEAEAKKACEMFCQKELQGRTIQVELADDAKRGSSRGGRRGTRGWRRGGGARKQPTAVEGKPSATCLFVSNLPWSYTQEDIERLFAAYRPSQIRMITRYNGMFKGFCFVDVQTTEDQQAAIAALNGKKCEGRDIIVRVALGEPHERKEAEEPSPAK